MTDRAHRRYVVCLAILFGVIWIGLAIQPRSREDWALENALTVLVLVGLGVFYRWLPLSRLSYSLIFCFLCLHALGAHYTYSEVPYDRWFTAVTGRSLNALFGWRRNNFDRLVHFMYGFLLAYPVREVLMWATGLRGFWSYFLALDLTMSTSATYELIEWGAAMVFGSELGVAYVGAQGDPWDAQRDMALAALGAALSTTIAAAVSHWSGRDPLQERMIGLHVPGVAAAGAGRARAR